MASHTAIVLETVATVVKLAVVGGVELFFYLLFLTKHGTNYLIMVQNI